MTSQNTKLSQNKMMKLEKVYIDGVKIIKKKLIKVIKKINKNPKKMKKMKKNLMKRKRLKKKKMKMLNPKQKMQLID